ncbi:MAG: Asp-tRNA(Asn)/Glu-tRNA(Gln) amidotransferase subunit GatA [Erysipelothrix sp.]|nr:Asp-tRNA(Asn)/Glu-tRNA(Gln) amidotransferase subunit GatA [Erysipelothrix sp.]
MKINVDLAKKRLQDAQHLNAVETMCKIEKDDNPELKLFDVAVVLKDNISTKGVKTTASSDFLKEYIPVFDATVVEKLVAAGATIIAKTSMDEFAMGGFGMTAANGPVLNPHDNSRVAGGSSAGSAALVAAKVVKVALGTDTGDSCRIPASYCGIVGFKPTYGRISRYGILPYASSLDHVGIFSNNVANSAKLLESLAGFDERDMTSSSKPVEKYSEHLNMDLSEMTVGMIDNVTGAISNNEIKKAFDNLIEKLNEKGIKSKNIEFDQQLFKNQNTIYKIIANAEAVSNHSNFNGLAFGQRVMGNNLEEIMTKSRSENIGLQARTRYLLGGYSLDINNIDKTFIQAKKVRRLLVDNINKELETTDFFIAPASAQIAPKLNEENNVDNNSDEHLIANNYMVMDNFTGNPGIVVPMCKVDNMPVGVYLSTKAFNEVQLLALANLIEEIVGDLS